MAGYTLYPEELDTLHSTYNIKPKSLFSTVNLLRAPKNEIKFGITTTNRVSQTFRPLRILLSLVGRWPFQPVTIYQNVVQVHPLSKNDLGKLDKMWTKEKFPPGSEGKEEIQMYTPSLRSLTWIYFLLTTLFLLIVLMFSILGFCDFFLEWHLFGVSSWDEEEKKNFESNLVPFVLVWSCLMHSSISSVSFLINRKKVSKFLNYWNFAVDAMDMDIPKGIRRYILMNHVGFLGFLVVIFIAYKILYVNLVRGGAALVGILTFRPFIAMLNYSTDLYKVRVFGVIVILYAVYASRGFLLLFSFKIKLLHHAFKIWNGRFKKLLRSPTSLNYKEEHQKCEKLFNDYRILLKLVRLTDVTFGAVLQSYYGSQLLNMCFELYYLARSGSYSDTGMDIIGAMIVLIQNLYIFFAVSLDAASVNEQATKGLEILRRYGISPEDSIHKKYLMSNMQLIFSQKIVLTGGKFFSVDRPFIVTVLGAVFTYFVIVLQVGPSFRKKMEQTGVEH